MAELRFLITGGAGFIGSHLVRLLLEARPGLHVVNLDLLTYAGNRGNLIEVMDHPRHTFVQGDIRDEPLVRELVQGVDGVMNLAAETHVDRSIRAPRPFTETNVLGTHVLLDAARAAGVRRFVQVSTDEVYGEIPDQGDHESGSTPGPGFSEESPLRPRSPYSASKAAADLLALSYHHTYGLDVVIPRGSNNYGPRQHEEKLIPLMALAALEDRPLPLYGDGLHVRDWIFVEDFCRGIMAVFDRGKAGRVYNLGAGVERTNLEVVEGILRILGKPRESISFCEDRPGHDRRYSMDCSRARKELKWRPEADFTDELRRTVIWYENRLAEGQLP